MKYEIPGIRFGECLFFIHFEIFMYNKHPSWQYHHEGCFNFNMAGECNCLDEEEWEQQ